MKFSLCQSPSATPPASRSVPASRDDTRDPFGDLPEGLRLATPARGFVTALLALMCATSHPVYAQPKGKADKGNKPDAAAKSSDKGDKKSKEKTFDFENLKLNGQMRTPQLLYFLERANEELERASLEKRSFIPHMVRSVEEEAL
jgi:hypothetical protein